MNWQRWILETSILWSVIAIDQVKDDDDPNQSADLERPMGHRGDKTHKTRGGAGKCSCPDENKGHGMP